MYFVNVRRVIAMTIAGIIAMTLGMANMAYAQPITTAPVSCNGTWRSIEAGMTVENATTHVRTTTFRAPTDDEFLQLQQRCHRGQMTAVSHEYDVWVHTPGNADSTQLDQTNMLMGRSGSSQPVVCDERWGATTVGTGAQRHCECPEGRIMVRIAGVSGNRVGCAAGPGFAQEYVTRAMFDTEVGTICGGAADGPIHDRCVAFRTEYDQRGVSLQSLQDGFTTLRDDVTNIRRDLGAVTDHYCPPTTQCPAADMNCRCRVHAASLATGTQVSAVQNDVHSLAQRVNRRNWRVGGSLSVLVGLAAPTAPYVSVGPTVEYVWGHVDDDGACLVARGDLGVTGAPNVGSGVQAGGFFGPCYNAGPARLSVGLRGGGMWTPGGDSRFRGTSLSWFAGVGANAEFNLSERLRLNLGLAVVGGQTTQVNDQGQAGRVGGPYLLPEVGLAGTW